MFYCVPHPWCTCSFQRNHWFLYSLHLLTFLRFYIYEHWIQLSEKSLFIFFNQCFNRFCTLECGPEVYSYFWYTFSSDTLYVLLSLDLIKLTNWRNFDVFTQQQVIHISQLFFYFPFRYLSIGRSSCALFSSLSSLAELKLLWEVSDTLLPK